ncbi:MAG: hypothetical protein HC930_11550 [Hydrococcus sp. SU_1_0]|nr:hypothetical protein [Hydrococcus sp. SU_1_0]
MEAAIALPNRTPEQVKEIEDRYSYNLNEKGEVEITYEAVVPNELELLNNLKESTINEIKKDISFYKNTSLYSEIVTLLKSFR